MKYTDGVNKVDPQLRSMTPGQKAVLQLVVAIILLGIAWFFLEEVMAGHERGDLPLVYVFGLVVIGSMGLLFAAGFLYNTIAATGPNVQLRADRESVILGEVFEVEWSILPAGGRIQQVRIVLEGLEESRDRFTRSNHWTSNTFVSVPVMDLTEPKSILNGNLEVRVPRDSMHSFEFRNNRIFWRVHLVVDIRGRPDATHSIPIEVKPLPLERL